MTPEVHDVERPRRQHGSAVDVPRWLVTVGAWGWRLLVGAAALLVVARLLRQLEVVVVPVAIALLLSTVLTPPAMWLRRRRLPPAVATLAVFLAVFVIAGLLGYWIVPILAREVSLVGTSVTDGVDRLQNWLVTGPLGLSTDQVAGYRDQIAREFSAGQGGTVSGVVRGARTALDLTVGSVLSIVLTFFFVKDGGRVVSAALRRADPDGARRLRTLVDDLWSTLGGYVRGTAANGLVNAVVLAVGLAVLGVPLIVPLAVLTFFAGFAPLVGAFVAGGAAALVALADGGVTTALAVVVLTIGIHHLEGYVVGPFVMGRSVRLPPAAVLVALSVGGVLAGLAGLLFAVPTVACTLAVYRWAATATANATDPVDPIAETTITELVEEL